MIASIFMLLVSGLILYPEATDDNVLTALRVSSLTTAIPFLLVFIASSQSTITGDFGQWIGQNRRCLWLILTISHFIHLYQIYLYYQLGQSCPLTVWLATSPLWLIMVLFSAVELINPCTILSSGTFWKAASSSQSLNA
ncbi:MAG: hypothetical protein F6K11_21410, partial [Leptolyngbya sp. SIO3F4]|nr:hypothetical protein [Leptolyngbya sp. SIO3F4]